MANRTVMDRLRDINAVETRVVTDEALWSRILAIDPDPRLTQPSPRPRAPHAPSLRHPLARLPRRWALTGLAGLLAAALALNWLLLGSTPTAAQAFPVLDRPATLTPAGLQHALDIYGAAPGDAGLDLAYGRPIRTPWGKGYVLTNRDRSFICAVAPASFADGWGASCDRTARARDYGTIGLEFSYDLATGSARYLMLLPARATATVKAPGREARPVPLHDGVLALTVAQPLMVTTHIGDVSRTTRLTPRVAGISPRPPTSQTTTTRSQTSAR